MRYNQLKKGEMYVTSYPNQGDYIFIYGDPNAGSLNNETPHQFRWCSGYDIKPENGFNLFRLPTEQEKYQFSLGEEACCLEETIIPQYEIY